MDMNMSIAKFTKMPIELNRVSSLVELVTKLKEEDVELDKVYVYQNGFMVTFKDIQGDAVLHDGSYGHESGCWETIGMPWDNSDVSVHSAKDLAKMLGALKLW